MSSVVQVTLSNYELLTKSSHGHAKHTAIAGNPTVDLTDEAPPMATNHSASSQTTQCSAMLGHSTAKKGDVLLFENSDEELDYLQRKYICLEKQRRIECLRARVLGNNTHQRGESLSAIAEPRAPK